MLGKKFWLTAASSLLLAACVNDNSGGTTQTSTSDQASGDFWQEFLIHYADDILLPAYLNAQSAFTELAKVDGPISQYCQALGTESEAHTLSQAQLTWRDSMAAWQQVEVMQLGPLLENGGALRNRIYSYDSSAPTSACAVDQSVVLAQSAEFDINQRSNSSKGLGALEYLLFSEDLNHQCAPQVTVTQDWNQLADLSRKQQRCAYAEQVAGDLLEAAQTLNTQWTSFSSNYYFEFTHPSYIEDRLNAISDALFYIEILSKDKKLGVPTGIHSGCSALVCPQVVESPYSENALENIKNNLIAFRQLLNGGEGIGFDDEIIRKGFSSTVEAFNSDIDAAISIVENSDSSLLDQLNTIEQSNDRSGCDNAFANPESLSEFSACRLHGMLKRITDRLRTDFVTLVNLDLPDRATSDND